MIRTFKEHNLRDTELLDGLWDFVFDKENRGITERWYSSFPSMPDRIPVPGCWNNELGKYDYEGVAWYRTRITLNRREHLRLVFHAVLGHADVYWNGQHLGYHYGGFTPFEFILQDVAAGVHELIIRTDSTLDRTTIPIDAVDWLHYGGIIRPVELQRLPEVFIESLRVTYRMTGETSADLQVKLRLRSLAKEDRIIPVEVSLDSRTLYTKPASVPSGQTVELESNCPLTALRRWHPGKPELYTVSAIAGEDDRTDRIGFRTIEARKGKILLNGEEIRFQGVNRHEEHPEWGFAFPNKLMKKELDIILNLGCNAVRGSHYPQSKYWIDLLDEHGILYWSEIPMWGAHMPKEVTAQPLFIERADAMVREMVLRDLHHPSILFWSVHNEIPTSSREAYDLSVKLVETVRSLDRSRLVTYATMMPLEDICLGLFDVIGINKYFGWYEGSVEEFRSMLDRFYERCRDYGAEDTPIMMTEFGGAGIYGDTGWEPRLFSEDYQAHVLSKALMIFREDPRICGTFIWQFADVRGDLQSGRSYFRDRARSFNNKGLVNEHRKPKLAYRVVRSIYREDAELFGEGSLLPE